jgi:hypothetical protein
MENADFTSGVVITYVNGKAPDVAWVVEIALRRTAALAYDERTIRHLDDLGVVIALDGARVAVLVHADRAGDMQVALAVGGRGAPDPLRGQRQAFCRLMAETLTSGRKPVGMHLFTDTQLPDEGLLRRQFARVLQGAVTFSDNTGADPDPRALREVLHAPDLTAPAAPPPRRLSPMRAGIGLASGVALAASLPVGAGLLAWNALRGPDLRATAAALAVVGLAQGLGVLPLLPMI